MSQELRRRGQHPSFIAQIGGTGNVHQMVEENITDNLEELLEILPPDIRLGLESADSLDGLLEVIMDLGRPPEARFAKHVVRPLERMVSYEDIEWVVSRVGSFGDDNRAGIERTLHRISAMRNRRGEVIGLTCRVGRAVQGTIDVVRDLVESGRSILILGRPGVGKCVTADTWLFTEHGMRTIGSFSPEKPADGSFYPLDLRLAALNGQEQTSHFYYDGVRPTRRLTTRMGYTLQGTVNHPVLVLDQDGQLRFKPLAELRTGEHVAVQRGQNLFGRCTALPAFRFVKRTNANDCWVPERLTADLARYLGYIVAEGTTTYQYTTGFSGQDLDVQDDVAGLVDRLFGLPLEQHRSKSGWNGRDFRVNGRKHRTFLAHLGVDYVRAAGKQVPACILAAPKRLVAEFLRGYFEGEGSIGKQYGVEVSSASAVMMRQIHVMLLNFGIVSKLRARLNKKYQRYYYYLNIKGHNVETFAREIGFVSRVKHARLAEILGGERNTNLDVVPNLVGALVALRQQVSLLAPRALALVTTSGHTIPSLHGGRQVTGRPTLSKYVRTGQSPGYETLGRILAETEDLGDSPIRRHLETIHEARFYFDPITTLEDGEAPVYDFTVPGSHSFFGNGLVNHNTTKLREIARILSDDMHKRVIVIDTSNEIAGDGDIPHPAIGGSRRMQVARTEMQHAVMIEAVENHMPEVIVIDEISTTAEALAARTIAERGVQLIGTAHGNSIENLVMNPSLNDLVGGIQSVTLGDEEAKRRGTQKTVLERKAPPTFDIAIEIQDRYRLAVHQDVAEVVDQLLRGYPPNPEIRAVDETTGDIHIVQEPQMDLSDQAEKIIGEPGAMIHIYPYAVSRSQIERVIRTLRVPATVTKELDEADAVLILKSYAKNGSKIIEAAELRQVPVYVVKSNTIPQIQKTLREVMHLDGGIAEEEEEALQEARAAIESMASSGQPVELSPRSAFIRRMQHQLVEQYHLRSESTGTEPNRRIKIFPRGMASGA